ncbi:MAG: phospho-sugar mutase [Corynebacterium sp.]|nr:phospho-sugar mutase [Corynebacterium sp.]
MSEQLTFGTAGMRAPVGPAAHQMNVFQVTRITAGVAKWLGQNRIISPERKQFPEAYSVAEPFAATSPYGIGVDFHDDDPAPRVVVGYDSRYGSHIFATTTAEVFAGAGFEVFLMPMPTPTPVIPWLVRGWELDGGVQITASHNPAGDNGYKVYMNNGRQLSSSAAREIEALIAAVPPASEIPRVTVRPCPDQLRRFIDETTSIVMPSQSDLLRVNNERANIKVALTAMHGVGGRAMVQALQSAGFAQIFPVACQQYPDPTFPTVEFPNPEEPEAVAQLLRLGKKVAADIVIALDPDADRCAVGIRLKDGTLRMLRGDETGPLLATRLVAPWDGEGEQPIVATTMVSSQLLAAIAADRGWDLRLTPTGFKNLTAAGGDRAVAFAYEEAMGIAPVPWLVDDKDGITTALVACTWAAELKAQGRTLADELESLYKKYGIYVGQQIAIRTSDPAALISSCIHNPPTTLSGVTLNFEPVFHSERPGTKPTGLLLRGESPVGKIRVRARASGTEPKAKLYLEIAEATNRTQAEELLQRITQEITTYIRQL